MFGGLETTEEAGEDEEAVAARSGTAFPASVAPNNGAVITDLYPPPPPIVSLVWQIRNKNFLSPFLLVNFFLKMAFKNF